MIQHGRTLLLTRQDVFRSKVTKAIERGEGINYSFVKVQLRKFAEMDLVGFLRSPRNKFVQLLKWREGECSTIHIQEWNKLVRESEKWKGDKS